MLMQSIEGEPYLWKIVSVEEDVSPTIKTRLLGLSDELIDRCLSISAGDTKALRLEARSYLREVLKLLPNLIIDKNVFSSHLEEHFNSYNSDLLSYKLKGATEMIAKLKQLFAFEEVHRNMFSRNTELATQESLFVTAIIECKDLTKDSLVSSFNKFLKELVIAYDPATELYINELACEKLCNFKNSSEAIKKSTRTSIEGYLFTMVAAHKTQKVTLKFFRLTDDVNVRESIWDTVFENYYILEPLELRQVLTISKNVILVTFGFSETDKIMMIRIESLVVTQPYKFIHGKDTMIVQGSIPELMILINDREKRAYSACLTNKKIAIKDELQIYKDRSMEIISVCFLARKKLILYVYQPGRVEQYSLTANNQVSFSFIPPQRQLEIAVFEKRIIVLKSEYGLVFYNYDLDIIGKEKSEADFFLVENGDVTIININELGFVTKTTKKIPLDNAKKSIESDLSIHKIDLVSRKTIEFGKDLYSNLFKKSNFSAILDPASATNSVRNRNYSPSNTKEYPID